ncbi:uncharacterized protein N7496_001003 [Penicillium cataractarum]|uniref:Uncharacterized protein n=1 Tax=Penicillium cataractarum TaxID=2100454 RepID=A0A9W9VVG5_9EURO|nr:uncharacterized protein N7496_001003 [Penicillium cataractarum]KAJ5389935.1 hypothetical protein N7496_001003 [Penicillium cataractarum]
MAVSIAWNSPGKCPGKELARASRHSDISPLFTLHNISFHLNVNIHTFLADIQIFCRPPSRVIDSIHSTQDATHTVRPLSSLPSINLIPLTFTMSIK